MADCAMPDNPVVITACLALANTVDRVWLQNHVIARLLHHPRFTSKVKSNADGKHHFERVQDFTAACAAVNEHHIAIEGMLDDWKLSWEQREEMFRKRLCEILSTPLDMTRPLWKLFLFPGWSIASKEGEGEEAGEEGSMLVIRVHHSISDGIGLVKYFAGQMVDDGQDMKPAKLLVVPERQKERLDMKGGSKGQVEQSRNTSDRQGASCKARVINVQAPNRAQRLWENVADVYLSSLRMLIRDPESAFTRSVIQREKTCALLPPSEKLSVEGLKMASRALGITLNDMLYAAVSGACRRYLQERGDDLKSLKSMRCGIPFTQHMLDSFSATDVANKLAIVAMCLHVGEEDRKVRLERCVATLRRVKRSRQPGILMGMLSVVARLSESWRLALWRRLTRAISILFTNVAGPREAVKIGGVHVKSIHFFGPADGHVGVVVGSFSYMGKVAISVAGDVGRIHEPERFMKLLEEEIDALVEMSC